MNLLAVTLAQARAHAHRDQLFRRNGCVQSPKSARMGPGLRRGDRPEIAQEGAR
jgi:hypothetical protein